MSEITLFYENRYNIVFFSYRINYSLNGDLAVDEQFDCPTQENKNLKNSVSILF